VLDEFLDLPFLAHGESVWIIDRRGGRRTAGQGLHFHAQLPQQRKQCLLAHRANGASFVSVDVRDEILERPDELACAEDLGVSAVEVGRLNAARRGATSAVMRFGRAVDFRRFRMLDEERARRDEAGDFSVAKLAQKANDIAVDRLGPDALAGIEVTADECGVDACVQRSGV